MCKVNRNMYGRLMFAVLMLIAISSQVSCKKYLDKKPSQDLAVPTTIKEFQAILDNPNMNTGRSPGYLELVADNYFITTSSWNAAFIAERTSYIWDENAIPSFYVAWNPAYQNIYYSNFVLDYLPGIKINDSEKVEFERLMGTAYFFRAFMFHQLAQLFCKPYSPSASTDMGIVLRLSSAVEPKSIRASVQQTYDQIIADLKLAADLLPAITLYSTRPNKAAAYGELARVYLSMRDYSNALKYAEDAIAINGSLLDYNSLAPSYALPSFVNNPEIQSLDITVSVDQLYSPQGIIDTTLYKSYEDNDLRKQVFFEFNNINGTYHFKGSYFPDVATFTVFDGIATDEIYLIQAESNAKLDHKNEAMASLNTLLRKRWKSGTYVDRTASDANDALNQIRTERRKELLFRGLRWSDLRRFNLEGADITLKRVVNSNTYELPPNDLRWVLLIPDMEIARSGIPQNPR